MSEPDRDDAFIDRVMGEVARSERRLPLVVAALGFGALALAVPGLIALRARPALDAALALAVAGLGETITAIADNPLFWVGLAIAGAWLVWLATLAVRGRR